MGEKIKLEFIARITTPDGKVIERKVEADGTIPTPDDFDMSSKMGFLESFDAYEKAALAARNKAGEEITAEYLAEVSKKNEKKKK
jgi:3-dehydroquinate synthase class II